MRWIDPGTLLFTVKVPLILKCFFLSFFLVSCIGPPFLAFCYCSKFKQQSYLNRTYYLMDSSRQIEKLQVLDLAISILAILLSSLPRSLLCYILLLSPLLFNGFNLSLILLRIFDHKLPYEYPCYINHGVIKILDFL